MFLGGRWYTIDLGAAPKGSGAAERLDVSRLQDVVLTPLLGIGDIRTDKRIDFVGGARGTRELETAGAVRQVRRRVLDVSGQRGRPDDHLRCRRHHAPQIHVVRAQAQGRVAVTRHMRRASGSRLRAPGPGSGLRQRRTRTTATTEARSPEPEARSPMKVLVADKFEPSGLEALEAAGCDVLYEPDLADAALAPRSRRAARTCLLSDRRR